MNKLLSDVRIFHETYGVPVLSTPTIPEQPRIDLRLSLINEEVKELEEAIAAGDIVEIADALVDLMYVTNGAILEFGMQDLMKDASYEFNTFTALLSHPNKPTGTPRKVYKLNLAYLKVVVKDLKKMLDQKHLNEVADYITDLVEIILVVALDFGLHNCFYACHDEVQASNMSKLGEDGKPLYREDGKVLKGPNFFKPDLAKLIK